MLLENVDRYEEIPEVSGGQFSVKNGRQPRKKKRSGSPMSNRGLPAKQSSTTIAN